MNNIPLNIGTLHKRITAVGSRVTCDPPRLDADGRHWLYAAADRIAAGDDEALVMADFGYGITVDRKSVKSYEEAYKSLWEHSPPHDKKLWIDAWNSATENAISVVESYRVSVGNSSSGELAAEWTMNNLREVRDELRSMLDCYSGK